VVKLAQVKCECGGTVIETALGYACEKCKKSFGNNKLGQNWANVKHAIKDNKTIDKEQLKTLILDTLHLMSKYGTIDETIFSKEYENYFANTQMLDRLESCLKYDLNETWFCINCQKRVYSEMTDGSFSCPSFTTEHFKHLVQKCHDNTLIPFDPPYKTFINRAFRLHKHLSFKTEFPLIAKLLKGYKPYTTVVIK
jgi:hypothetical protein